MKGAGALCVLGLSLIAGSARAEWKDGEPVPAGYRVERSSKRALVLGAMTLGMTWAASASVGALMLQDPALSVPLFIPVVGPFIEVGTFTYRYRNEPSWGVALADVAFLLDGFVQATGLVLVILGARTPSARLVKVRAVEAELVPMWMVSGGAGVGVFGRF